MAFIPFRKHLIRVTEISGNHILVSQQKVENGYC